MGGKFNSEGSAAAFTVALGADAPAVKLNQVADDRKAKTQAAMALGAAGVGLLKSGEQMRQKLLPDSNS